MNVPYLVKVPIKADKDLRERLRSLQDSHTKDLDKIRKQMQNKPTEMGSKKMADLTTVGRMLTMANLIRVSMRYGMDSLPSMKDEVLLKHITENGVAVGRPRTKR